MHSIIRHPYAQGLSQCMVNSKQSVNICYRLCQEVPNPNDFKIGPQFHSHRMFV